MSTDNAWQWGGVGFQAGILIIVLFASVMSFVSVKFDRNIGSRRDVEAALADAPAAADNSVAVRGAAGKPAPALTVAVPPPQAADGSAGAPTPSSAPHRAVASPGDSTPGSVAIVPVPATPTAGGAVTVSAAIAFQPMTVAFSDVTYTVKLSKRAGGGLKTLLHGISGFARPGRMLALMGASGAGKTTLLDVLAGRKNSGVMTGSVMLNGFPKDERSFNRITCYIEQNDMVRGGVSSCGVCSRRVDIACCRGLCLFAGELRAGSLYPAVLERPDLLQGFSLCLVVSLLSATMFADCCGDALSFTVLSRCRLHPHPRPPLQHAALTTVREAVELSAALRMPAEVTPAERAAHVDHVLELLELSDIAGRLVGLPGAAGALAPAERKRLTIAVELASNAPVLFADEPSSGLDSRAAAIVMRVLRRVASTGRTVIW
jgi:ABC-type Mn2+/Zn2+ transport system ATPase subunit